MSAVPKDLHAEGGATWTLSFIWRRPGTPSYAVDRGAYDSSATYVPGDRVKYNNAYYVAIAESTDVLPTVTASWTVVVLGDPYDLTGCTARMQVRPRAGGDVYADLSTENGKITLGGATGAVHCELSAVETAAIMELARKARYDLAVVFPSGIREYLLAGRFIVDVRMTAIA